METYEYTVEIIDGDYAHLRKIDLQESELKLVARALLPPEIMEGTRLQYSCFEYNICQNI